MDTKQNSIDTESDTSIPSEDTISMQGTFLIYQGALYNFNPENIGFSEITKRGPCMQVTPYYNLKLGNGRVEKVSPIKIQTPILETRFGWNPPKYKDASRPTSILDLTLPEGELFTEVMKKWDDVNRKACLKNRSIWFKNGNEIDEQLLGRLYNPIVKRSVSIDREGNEREYDPKIRLKIYHKKKDMKPECQVFSENSRYDNFNMMNLEKVGENTKLRAIFTFPTMSFKQEVFTPIKAQQLWIKELGEIKAFSFVE